MITEGKSHQTLGLIPITKSPATGENTVSKRFIPEYYLLLRLIRKDLNTIILTSQGDFIDQEELLRFNSKYL